VIDPYAEFFELPEELELAVREKDGKRFSFILNYSRKPQSMWLKKELREMLTGSVNTGEVVVDGYGVQIYELQV
jgi:beta-galactosidase